MIQSFLFLSLYAQSHYDYMDDNAVSGGAERALNGIVFIFVIILLLFIVTLFMGGISKVYYWINPEESPEHKAAIKKEEQDTQHLKEKKVKEQKQAIITSEQKKEKEAIDLGLSVMWSSTNIYANMFFEKGAKYSWGDIVKKIYFIYIDSKLTDKNKDELKRIFNIEDLSICGNKKYDAAKFLWGDDWRLPQKYEFDELLSQCEWNWTSINGISGYKVTGKNGNSIFLPVTGEIVVDKENVPNAGFYWSGTANDDILGSGAYFLYFDERQRACKRNGIRWHGMAVRPVWSQKTEIVIKDGFTMSSFGAKLIKCNNIEECHIPYGVKVISKEAFKDAKNIKILHIPNTVEEIEGYAFSQLNIESVYIPNSIVRIGKSVFEFCNNLKYIQMEEGLSKLGFSMFTGCCSLESITIPDSVKYLPESIFEYCTCLKNVKLSKNLTHIGDLAFCRCDSLESINLPNSLIGLQDGTFEFCGYLSSIIIPEGVVAICNDSFSGCSSLTRVRIPGTLQCIESNAFNSCYGITLEVPKGTSIHYKQLNINGVEKIVEYDTIMPNNVEELKAKCDTFVIIQKSKRKSKDYESRKNMGLLTKEEIDHENYMLYGMMDDLDDI